AIISGVVNLGGVRLLCVGIAVAGAGVGGWEVLEVLLLVLGAIIFLIFHDPFPLLPAGAGAGAIIICIYS
ncbi:hypothetical protein EDD22DRAFT_898396, partial [Suillus occidentalis]